ncbi:hypothetical protein [Helicobacter rodentium]|nr:hypothetical protein [Helicobacter rodentium]
MISKKQKKNICENKETRILIQVSKKKMPSIKEIYLFAESIADFLYTSNLLRIIVGGFTIYLAISQLWYARKNTRLNIAKNEIDIFNKLDERQKLLGDYQCQFMNSQEKNSEELDYLLEQEKQAKEHYLNLLDTICLYALNKNITRENFFTQYKNMLLTINEIYQDEIKNYENIKKAIKYLKDNTN